MGLEAYLLLVTFKEPLSMSEAKRLIEECGAKSSSLHTQTEFEIKDGRGLTELRLDTFNQEQVRSLHLRFSILSPHTVIDQAFEFLNKLSEHKTIRLFDTHLKMKELPIDATQFKRNPKAVKRRQTVIENQTGMAIACGKPTTDYIHEHHLENMYKSDEDIA
jgi:hypothetical protein